MSEPRINANEHEGKPDQPQMNAEERRYKHAELTEQVMGVFYGVYNELGIGFPEKVYREAMVLALREKEIEVQCELPLPVWFRGVKIGAYEADLAVASVVSVELKAAKSLDSAHEAQ